MATNSALVLRASLIKYLPNEEVRGPPDFGSELDASLDDQGPVRMHRHAGLPLNHEGTESKERDSSPHTSW